MTQEEVMTIAQNKHLNEARLKRLHEIYQELKEIGYAGLSGSFKVVADEGESKFLLSLEEQFRREEQQKIIDEPFDI